MLDSEPPERQLEAQLCHLQMNGTFEAHITTAIESKTEQERFRQLCHALGVKCVVIELPQGDLRQQPMTASYHRGPIAQVVTDVVHLTQSIRQEHFPIARLKLEAVATNNGIPETEGELSAFPPTCYFEHHIKLLLDPGTDFGELDAICQKHQAHLSSNALKQQSNGTQERFLTLRHYHTGRIQSFDRLERLTEDLKSAGFQIAGKLREYSLFDSRVALDAGWIEISQKSKTA